MTVQQRAVIVGGGFAGWTTGYFLAQDGWDVTIIERSGELRDSGYAIDVRGPAVQVLQSMGILDAARELDANIETVRFLDASGKTRVTLSADVFGGRAESDLELLRGDLLTLIVEATRASVTWRPGTTVSSIAFHADGVAVTLSDGSRLEAELLVGADGLHSMVRSTCFTSQDALQPLGVGVSIATIPNEVGLHQEEVIFPADGVTLAAYSARDADEAKAMFFFKCDAGGRRLTRADLERAVAPIDEWRIQDFLAWSLSAPDLYVDELAIVRMDGIVTDRIALVGDSGYCASPASGQGTSLALIGGYLLADAIRTAGSVAEGLQQYQDQMLPFAAANQKLAPAAVRGMVSSGWLATTLQKVMFALPGGMFQKLNASMQQAIQKAATSIALPAR